MSLGHGEAWGANEADDLQTILLACAEDSSRRRTLQDRKWQHQAQW
jgi:hypothetical protein